MLLAEHLQSIKCILEEDQHKCTFGETNFIRDSDLVKGVDNCAKKPLPNLFSSQKIVPVVLEEEEINR